MASTTKRKKKKNKKSSKAAWLVLLLVLIGAGVGCLFSPTFNIISVTTKDGVNVTSGEILNAANIICGENIFRINATKISQKIEDLPYIKTAKVIRKLPDEILLKYEERVPYAYVKYLESFAITDNLGYVLEITKENTLKELPIIYGIDIKDIEVGKSLAGVSKLKHENSVYLFEAAKKPDFKYVISEVNYDDSSNVKLVIKDVNIDVVFGTIKLDDLEEKVLNLSVILERIGNKKGSLDMSNDNYLEKTVFTEKI